MKSKDAYERIIAVLEGLEGSEIDRDEEFNGESRKHILERDQKYSDLLEHFVEVTKRRNDSKEKYKWIYFKILMAL